MRVVKRGTAHFDMSSQLVWYLATSALLFAYCAARSTKDLALEREVPETIPGVGQKHGESVPSGDSATDRGSRSILNKFGLISGIKNSLISNTGTLAASNSLKVFGKVMNTALSVSYGHADDLIGDLLPDIQQDEPSDKDKDKDVRQEVSTKKPAQPSRSPIQPSRSPIQPTRNAIASIRNAFLKAHNDQVSRINHRFFKSESFRSIT